jgi:hypothetical protein
MNQRLIVIYYNGKASYDVFALFNDSGGLTVSASEYCARAGDCIVSVSCVSALAEHFSVWEFKYIEQILF